MYIAEVFTGTIRGKLVSINQLTVVIGILLAATGELVDREARSSCASAAGHFEFVERASGWRWMFGVTAIPATLFFIGTFMIPESPRLARGQGWTDTARSILARIGGKRL